MEEGIGEMEGREGRDGGKGRRRDKGEGMVIDE